MDRERVERVDLYKVPHGTKITFTTKSGSTYEVVKNDFARTVGMGIQAGLTIHSNSSEFKVNPAKQGNHQAFRNIEVGAYWHYENGFEPTKTLSTSTVTAIFVETP